MIASCFVILMCSANLTSAAKECAFNVNTVKLVYGSSHESSAYVDEISVNESVEEVTKKFKQECGR